MKGHTNLITQLLSIFSTTQINPTKLLEEFEEVRISSNIKVEKMPDEADYQLIISQINKRDAIHLSILKNDEVIQNFHSNSNAGVSSPENRTVLN